MTATALKRIIVNAGASVIDYTAYKNAEIKQDQANEEVASCRAGSRNGEVEIFYAEGGIDPSKTEVTSVSENTMETMQYCIARKLRVRVLGQIEMIFASWTF